MKKQIVKNKEIKKAFFEKQNIAHRAKKAQKEKGAKNQFQQEREKRVSLLTRGDFKGLHLTKKEHKLKMSRFDDKRSSYNKSGVFFENLINVETTAEVLGVAPKTIRKWVSLRFIPYIKLGSRVLFRPRSLELWLNQKENKSWL